MSTGGQKSQIDKLFSPEKGKSNPFKGSEKGAGNKGLAKKILPMQDITLLPVAINTAAGTVMGFQMIPTPKDVKPAAQNPTQKPGGTSYANKLFKPGMFKI